ncbi:high choriolytic enzyme 2-like [Amblyraja radiata]|uniref:high choriolytic enzyme 2-like n=1 Tax=Amblyraja radiata TaxID=386614 RepID=UPI001402C2EA|nr:high choriolytic enzyme 2-like [Amblyraja radiata]
MSPVSIKGVDVQFTKEYKYLGVYLDNNSERRIIKRALHEIATFTCVKFYEPRRHKRAFVSVTAGAGCYAIVGFTGRQQILSLNQRSCLYFGIIEHEFLHSIGFQHEHCRSDRDTYVRILWQNVMKSKKIKHPFWILQVLDDEGLQILICEGEAILNARPITKSSDDPMDLETLPPNHLLLLKAKPILPPGLLYFTDQAFNFDKLQTNNLGTKYDYTSIMHYGR